MQFRTIRSKSASQVNQADPKMRFFFVCMLSVLFSQCFGQRLLFHKNRYKEVLYEAGETISFNLKGSKSKITAQIKHFEGDFIVFEDFKINPNDIASIYVDAKTRTWFILRYKYQKVLLFIGLGYLALDFINTGSLSKETVLLGSSLVAAPLLAKIFISEKIKIKGSRKVVIIH